MKTKAFLLATLCFGLLFSMSVSAQSSSELTLSEVMFYPSENNGEYIEIYNTSLTQTIDLSTVKFKYSTSTSNSFVSFIGGTNLAPGKFAVVLQGNYDYENGAYKRIIPADAIILKLSSNNFGTSGMANTTSRDVYLINGSSQVIDAYTYTADNNSGISDEKFLETKDNTVSNWRNSIKLNGTPGFQNSITPVKFINDLSIKLKSIVPTNPVEGDTVKLNFIVKNVGVYDAGQFNIDVFQDQNGDSTGQAAERFFNKTYPELFVIDSVIVSTKFYADKIGLATIIGNVNYDDEENPVDNKLIVQVKISEKPVQAADLLINEVMYAPNNQEPEWIEFINKSTRQVNLKNWKISDSNSLVAITTSDLFLNPGEMVVVSNDESISNYYPYSIKIITRGLPSLGNNGDDIILKSGSGMTIDSLRYLSAWGGSNGGYSLERLSISTNTNEPANWKSSVSKYKATPSKLNSVTQKNYDLSVKNFYTTVQYAEVGKVFPLTAVIENIGKYSVGAYTVKLYRDLNLNGIEESGEQIAERQGATLIPAFYTNFSFSVDNFSTGINQYIVRVEYAEDEFTENNNLLIRISGISINEIKGDLTVNEFMYAPLTDEPEWIEIFNRSQKEINLKGYQIGNGTVKSKVISKDVFLKPDEYFLITKDSSMFSKYSKPVKWIVASFPALTNIKDKIVLSDSLNRTIDSLEYKNSWGGANGKSLEKIEQSLVLADSVNWKTSVSKYGGTPGKINSVTKKNFDLLVKSFSLSASYAEIGKNIPLNAVVTNNGKFTVQDYSVKLYNDANFNGINEVGELIAELPGTNLISGASASFSFSTSVVAAGQNQFIVKTDYSADEFNENNDSMLKVNGVFINEVKGDLVINEILHSAKSVTQQWIEIYNKSKKIINLKGYQIFSNGKKNKVITEETLIKPDDYYVIARDSSVFGFNSKLTAVTLSAFTTLTGKIAILDSLNRAIDSLDYKSTWGGSIGKSLERIDPSKGSSDSTNWKTTVSKYGGTPGGINSTTQKNYDLFIKSFLSTVRYSEVGKNSSLSVAVSNNGKSIAKNYSVKLFKDINFNGVEDPNELLAELPGSNLNAGSSANFSFSTNNIVLGQNRFIVRVDFSNDEFAENNSSSIVLNGIIINEVKGDLVINEIMYSSRYVTQQWIEIFNKSQKVINLNGYQLLSGGKKTKVVNKDIYVNPDNYLVIARDSSVFNYNSKLAFAVVTDFGSMSGKVAILDSLNRSIDSLEYKSAWGGTGGKSLERIEVSNSSADSTNWKSSVSQSFATPGLINSVSKKNYDIALTKISFNPAAPSIGQRVRVRVEVFNLSRNDASFKLILNKINKDGSKQKVEETSALSLSKEASLIYEFTYAIENLLAKTSFECIAVISPDDDANNNIVAGSITPGYTAGLVLLNEVMYNPLNGEPEWIELYNNSNYDIDLEDWSISDVLSTPQKINIKAKDYFFAKNTFLVIAKDSTVQNYHRTISSKLIVTSFPSLNNDADGIVIKDSRNHTIDSVFYDVKWGGESGKSIERKMITAASTDKNNWSSSRDIELSTPGRINSISLKKYDLAIRTIVPLPLYPTINQDINIAAKIINYGSSSTGNFSVKYFTKESKGYVQFAETFVADLNSNDSTIVTSTKINLQETKTVLLQSDL